MSHKKRRYASDLTQMQWLIIKPLIAKPKGSRGRPMSLSQRVILNAIFYVLKTTPIQESWQKNHTPTHSILLG